MVKYRNEIKEVNNENANLTFAEISAKYHGSIPMWVIENLTESQTEELRARWKKPNINIYINTPTLVGKGV